MDDLCDYAGLTASEFDIDTWGYSTPQAISFFQQDVLSCLREIADEVGYLMYVDHGNAYGKLYLENPYGTTGNTAWGPGNTVWGLYGEGTATYILPQWSSMRWKPQTFSIVGQLDYTREDPINTPVQHDFPPSPYPFDANSVQVRSRIMQDSSMLGTTGVPSLPACLWYLANRHVGAIEVTTYGHDWLSHNDYVGIVDTEFTGFGTAPINMTSPDFWVVDGWTYEWNEKEFKTTMRLSPQLASLLRNLRRDMR